jgi:hydrogenase nickel incorporation protein HypB
MCGQCGCTPEDESEASAGPSHKHPHVHEGGEAHSHEHSHGEGEGHRHVHGQGGHSHPHVHGTSEAHSHEHTHGAGQDHDHVHGESPTHAARIVVDKARAGVLGVNSKAADKIREAMTRRGIVLVNITSGPGSGKTTLLKSTLGALESGTAAVLVGDLETERDAGRLRGLGAQVRQINTGKGCHLSAAQIAQALENLELEGLEFVFIENVGNMACPAEFDLGEHVRVALLSLPEGDDKVAKYPGLFAAADVILLNKIDLSRVLPFDEGLVKDDLSRINTRAVLLRLSAMGGQGLDEWIQWLKAFRAAKMPKA